MIYPNSATRTRLWPAISAAFESESGSVKEMDAGAETALDF